VKYLQKGRIASSVAFAPNNGSGRLSFIKTKSSSRCSFTRTPINSKVHKPIPVNLTAILLLKVWSRLPQLWVPLRNDLTKESLGLALHFQANYNVGHYLNIGRFFRKDRRREGSSSLVFRKSFLKLAWHARSNSFSVIFVHLGCSVH
jgi:hypothetical protein